jgi:hypothetical protein
MDRIGNTESRSSIAPDAYSLPFHRYSPEYNPHPSAHPYDLLVNLMAQPDYQAIRKTLAELTAYQIIVSF